MATSKRSKPGSRSAAASDTRTGKSGDAAPELSEYLDFRAFLRDYYVHKKEKRGFSFRAFSKRAGLGSPNYLKLVMDGERNLSPRMATRFAKALSLDADDTTYFCHLVQFNQATTSAEREKLYGKLTGFRRYRMARPLDAAHAEYHSTWYLPAIRELAARKDFRDDAEWIARTLWPPISADDARRAVETLVTLGLLVRADNGKIEQGEALVSTGPEAQRVHVISYHRAMLQRAEQSMDDIPAQLRDISSLTLCVDTPSLARLKKRIQRFRRELLEFAMEESEPKQVVQVNFQLFPLSKVDGQEPDGGSR